MSKFKVGDKVKVARISSTFAGKFIGKEGYVKEVDPSDETVAVEFLYQLETWWLNDKDLDIIKDQENQEVTDTPTFRVGDKVRQVKMVPEGWDNWVDEFENDELGKEFTIKRIHNEASIQSKEDNWYRPISCFELVTESWEKWVSKPGNSDFELVTDDSSKDEPLKSNTDKEETTMKSTIYLDDDMRDKVLRYRDVIYRQQKNVLDLAQLESRVCSAEEELSHDIITELGNLLAEYIVDNPEAIK